MTLNHTNDLLGTSYNLFPIEPPWLIDKQLLMRLVAYLREALQVESIAHVFPKLIEDKSKVYFEIILYRLFVIRSAPQTFTRVTDEMTIRRLRRRYSGSRIAGSMPMYLFDMPLNSHDRHALDYPAVSASVWWALQEMGYANASTSAWLRMHNDRYDRIPTSATRLLPVKED